jgi:hypothetical protein
MRDRFINVLIVIVIVGLAIVAILDINRRIKKECQRACTEIKESNERRGYRPNQR